MNTYRVHFDTGDAILVYARNEQEAIQLAAALHPDQQVLTATLIR